MKDQPKQQGISMCVSCRNSERTVKACVTSFMEFADEIIIVDNKSTDNTIKICQELEKGYPKVQFYNHPEIEHIYENRQVALERSSYKWIYRCDPDHVACDNIMSLRNTILKTSTKQWPIIFFLKQINLRGDIHHAYSTGVISKHMPRIFSFHKGMRWGRVGQTDGLITVRRCKWKIIDRVYWFHCHFKADMDHFFRTGLTPWEKIGDFKEFPSLESYMLFIAKTKYGTTDLKKACAIYMKKEYPSSVVEYDPKKYQSYPSHVIKNFKT